MRKKKVRDRAYVANSLILSFIMIDFSGFFWLTFMLPTAYLELNFEVHIYKVSSESEV